MKRRHTMLAATIALLAASSAQAVETWQFDHVTFKGQDSSALTLLSQSATATVVSMTSMAYATTLFEASSLAPEFKQGVVHEAYEVDVGDGYRVTGVTLQVDLQGKLEAAAPNGYAYNRLLPYFSTVGGGLDHSWYMLEVERLNGVYTSSAPLPQFDSENFTLNLDMRIGAVTEGAYELGPDGRIYTAPSYANIWADNITFTIHTAPVPEPSTYLMLGAGLALLGALGRYKRMMS